MKERSASEASSSTRDETEALRADTPLRSALHEIGRLRSQVRRLEEDKQNLEGRLGFLAQELERTRAEVKGQIRT
jgi:hypothetical protein